METDLPALTRLDLTYPTDRVLALERSGEPPEHSFALRWRNRRLGTHYQTPRPSVYNAGQTAVVYSPGRARSKGWDDR